MLKIKDDIPFINLMHMGFRCVKGFSRYIDYKKMYNDIEVYIHSADRSITCYIKGDIHSPNMCDHCIKDLVQKGYVEEI